MAISYWSLFIGLIRILKIDWSVYQSTLRNLSIIRVNHIHSQIIMPIRTVHWCRCDKLCNNYALPSNDVILCNENLGTTCNHIPQRKASVPSQMRFFMLCKSVMSSVAKAVVMSVFDWPCVGIEWAAMGPAHLFCKTMVVLLPQYLC